MSESDMIVKVFSVESLQENYSLSTVLSSIHGLPLEQRNRSRANGALVRVEHFQVPDDRRPFWMFDFVQLRYNHGPGRAGPENPVEGFDMSNGDGFAEETAMLYKPETGTLLAQYNHFGLKDGAAADYFSAFGPDGQAIGYEFHPHLDNDVEAKLARADLFTTVRLKVATNAITSTQRENHLSLDRVLSLGDALQAPFVEVRISVGHSGQSLSTTAVRAVINGVQGLISENPDAVKTAQFTGRDSEDQLAVREVLDMLAPQKKYTLSVEKDTNDLRFTRESRYQALQRALVAWERQQQ